ncbi:pyrroloquinoline quinone precursor peptide PqqA [Tunturibacter empetritectus]|uniref:Coenzyme PQQ synthesis protein A n=1 Tax=Tunturiibacter empetritectus TaxID=3069691 RepID=A0A7W8IJ53_9BACT|nr:coenzyme PQQ precursor peptide PqqA [Edaphobacter lichenicola]
MIPTRCDSNSCASIYVATLIARISGIDYTHLSNTHSPLEVIMQPSSWTTPEFEEISLNCEINSYAPVEL